MTDEKATEQTVVRKKAPVLYLELVDQGRSGMIKDGTANTRYEQELRTPTISWIPTEGIEPFIDKEDGLLKFKPVRHIAGCDTRDIQEQNKRGIVPNKMNDKIPFKMGFATVTGEGSTLSVYDYLKNVTFNEDNPLRPETATAMFREVKVDERAVQLLSNDELVTKAKSKVYALRDNTGGKDLYTYDDAKIDSYCRLLGLWDETSERRLVLLLHKASTEPKAFLDLVVTSENTLVTEITQAMDLGVIMFEGNTAQYTKESKVIIALGGKGNTKIDKKVEALSSYLQSPEGNAALTELRAKVEVEKENQFQK